MFTLKKNENLDIKKFQMTCDGRPPNLDKTLPWNFFMAIVGGPGSGKSNTWLNLISRRKKFYHRQFDKVFIFSPSLHTIKAKLKLPEENLIDGFDQARLQEIINEQQHSDDNTLIILDDVVSQLKDGISELQKFVYNRRHIGAGLSIIIVTQKYTKIPLELRVALSDILMFNKGRKELEYLADEYVNLDKKTFAKLVNYVFDAKHAFLYMKVDEPEHDKYHKKFDKIIFTDDSVSIIK
jgi:hypothetical protein